MRRQSGWRSISQKRSRHNTHTTTCQTVEQLSNSLDLGIIEDIWRRIRVHAQAVHSGFVTRVESGCRVGRVGDEGVNRMGHLVAKNREGVQSHFGLEFAVDSLVCEMASCRDHIRGHAISNEQDNVLSLSLFFQVPDFPGSNSLRAIVIRQSRRVETWLLQVHPSVGFARHLYQRGCLGVFCEEVFIPREIPMFKRWLNDLEVLSWGLGFRLLVGYGKSEVWVRYFVVGCLAAILGSVDLQA